MFCFQLSQFCENNIKSASYTTIKFSVSCFLNWDIDSYSNTWSCFFYNLVDIFDDFNNLRHDNYFFNNFFKDVWNFDYLLYGRKDGNSPFFVSVDNLNIVLDIINSISLFNISIYFNNLVSVDDNLSDFCVSEFDSNNLFFNSRNFDNLLMDNWDFYCFLSNSFYDLVNLDNHWGHYFELYNLWNLNHFFD